jgi:hypothetical protein
MRSAFPKPQQMCTPARSLTSWLQGHSGWTIGQLNGIAADVQSQHAADVVLIQVRTPPTGRLKRPRQLLADAVVTQDFVQLRRRSGIA